MAKTAKVRKDSYMNAFMPTGMRGRMSNYSAEMMGSGVLFDKPVLQSLYINNGFARIVADKPAEEMTRAGFEIEDLPDQVTQSIKSRLEELDATKHFNEALKWRRAFGGGIIVLGVKDGGSTLEIPVNETTIQAIEFMRVYDRYEAFVDSRYEDPTDPKYGSIKTWKINPSVGGNGGYIVHESRVLVFDGEAVPNDMRVANQGWGASSLQNCFNQLVRLDSAYKWSLLLLERKQQAIHSIPGLSQQIDTPEGEALVAKRVNVVDTVRGALNTVIIDAEETYEIKDLTIGGVNEILDRFIRALSAVSSIPAFLLGENITGLNTGSSNKEAWYSQVESWQNDQYRKPLDRLISLLRLAETKGVSDGGKYTLEFNPLFAPSDDEQATVDLKKEQALQSKMTTLTGYVNAGIMDQDEGREVIRDDYDLIGDAPPPEAPLPPDPLILNPGQKIVPHPNAPKGVVPPAPAAK